MASECEMMMIRVSLPADSFMPLAAGAAALLLDSGAPASVLVVRCEINVSFIDSHLRPPIRGGDGVVDVARRQHDAPVSAGDDDSGGPAGTCSGGCR